MANKEYRNEMREFRKETTWTFWHWFPVVVMVLIVMMGLGWFIQGNDFFLYKVFAPKYEQVRRETFEQTKSYNQGMVQELQNMMFEYTKASPSQKDALGSIILYRVADFPRDKMPSNLRDFIAKLENERMNPQTTEKQKY